jgi:hypothetical protein
MWNGQEAKGRDRRMKRRLFSLASLLSLLLCVATVVLWVRSYWTSYQFRFRSLSHTEKFQFRRGLVSQGRIVLIWTNTDIREGHAMAFVSRARQEDPSFRLGWRFESGENVAYSRPKALIHLLWTWSWNSGTLPTPRDDPDSLRIRVGNTFFPIWPLTVIFAAGPLIKFVWNWRRHHGNAGHCHACGYNLTGNTSGVCPECGTTAESKSVPSRIPDNSN